MVFSLKLLDICPKHDCQAVVVGIINEVVFLLLLFLSFSDAVHASRKAPPVEDMEGRVWPNVDGWTFFAFVEDPTFVYDYEPTFRVS